MNFSASAIAAGLLFGACGIYFLRKGKKDGNGWSMVLGVAMLLYPYFIESATLTWIIGAVLFMMAWYKR